LLGFDEVVNSLSFLPGVSRHQSLSLAQFLAIQKNWNVSVEYAAFDLINELIVLRYGHPSVQKVYG